MEDSTEKKGVIGTVTGWWVKPFDSGGTAFNWVMFVGLLVIATFLWQLVLLEFTKEI